MEFIHKNTYIHPKCSNIVWRIVNILAISFTQIIGMYRRRRHGIK